MNKKLFVTDLDGTLLGSNREVSDFTVKTLNGLIEEGVDITFATARSFISAFPILKNINFRLPAITHNGAHITNPIGEIIVENLLDYEIYKDIFSVAEKLGLSVFTNAKNEKGEERLSYTEIQNIAQADYIDERMKRNDKRLLKYEGEFDRILLIHFLDKEQKLQPVKEYISKKYSSVLSMKMVEDIYNHGFYGLQIYNKKANKGDMLVELLKILNRDKKDTVVFGDQLNDLELFEHAGTKIAVANAHGELKKKADFIIDSNDNDGVAKYILEKNEE